MNKIESHSPKDALCQVWLKLAQWSWRRSFFNFLNVFSLFRNYLHLEDGRVLHLNKLESSLTKDALCRVWLKLAQWSRRRSFLILSMYFRYFVIISPWKIAGPYIWTKLKFIHPRMPCFKIGWIWLSGSGEEDFQLSSMYFCYFVIISPYKRAGPFIWTNLNSLDPRMLCAKFGWNWLSGSWEEVTDGRTETDRQTTDERRSEKFTWAFSSGELKIVCFYKH